MQNRHHEERREAIRRVLADEPAQTQSHLVTVLISQGFDATQSGVSRDLREMGAIKTARGYEIPRRSQSADEQIAAVSSLIRDMRPAGPNLLIVHTAIGAAQRVALAFDRCNWPEVVGNIGGDDTVFVATHSALAQKNLVARVQHSART